MAKKTKKLPSHTTPGHLMLPRNWIAELVIWRSAPGQLSPYFWRENKWKWRYVNEVKAATKFMKTYGEDLVISVVCSNREVKTLASYGDIEFLLQEEKARLDKISLPKDRTEAIEIKIEKMVDLRPPVEKKDRSGLFERLAKYEK